MLRIKWVVRLVFATMVCVSIMSPASAGMSFSGLRYCALPRAISADGAVVVGLDMMFAFRHTQADGMIYLGTNPSFHSHDAFGVSANGSVIVGYTQVNEEYSVVSSTEAFRWTESEGMVSLRDLPGGIVESHAYAISADGSVIVGGSSSSNGYEAFRWTQSEGMVGMGDLSGGGFSSKAYDVSANGAVIVGGGSSSNGNEAFRWTQTEGMVGLGDLPGGGFSSKAYDVSADGSVIVGVSASSNGNEAFRWTQAEGMVSLGALYGSPVGAATGVSADGSVIVGRLGHDCFIWDRTEGMQSLKDLLTTNGIDITGWTLGTPAISDDGTTIVGEAMNPHGEYVGFIATIPEPATIGLLSLGGLVVLRRRRAA